MRSPENNAVIAAAGSGKTQTIIDQVLSRPQERSLIVTYTLQNQLHIEQRLHRTAGGLPSSVRVSGWMSFLLSDAVRPYQHAVLHKIDHVRGLDFEGAPFEFTRRSSPAYYVGRRGYVYGRNVADFACTADRNTGGAVIRRLEAIYDRIYIDEVQDLAGYDLDFLDLLFASRIAVTLVGDPRQALLATARVLKNKRYRGEGLLDWLASRSQVCTREDRPESWRCHADICRFASELFPSFPPIVSKNDVKVQHQGIFEIAPVEVHEYVKCYHPRVLRQMKTTPTLGYPAINIGEAKGSTFDRVLIFPTRTMRAYLRERDPTRFRSREHLYVAVTRARHSVAFVI